MKYLFFFFLISFWCQAQDSHLREADSVEELLRKKNPNQFRAMENKEKYLALEKVKTGKRRRIFLGDTFRFKTDQGLVFQDELTRLTDSTFAITYFDQTSNRYEIRNFSLSDVEKVYKRNKYQGLKWGLSVATLAPLIYDWIYFKVKPWQNSQAIVPMILVQSGALLLGNSKKFFNGVGLNENKILRVMQY